MHTTPPHNDQQPDWIDRLVKVGGALGLNQVRLRWKLIAWRDKLRNSRSATANSAHQVTRRHKSCLACRALNSVDDKRCTSCGARLPSYPVAVALRLMRLLEDRQAFQLIVTFACIATYVAVAIRGENSGWINQSARDLYQFGGGYTPAIIGGEWWRLGTAVLLHGGLWHILFNLYALWYVTPMIEAHYGLSKMLLIFVVTGVGASAISTGYELYVTPGSYGVHIGASGALCGLIGVAIGWGHRRGGTVGRMLRDAMLRWVVYIVIFGFLIRADNVAHLGGVACGLACAYLIPDKQQQRTPLLWMVLGLLSFTAITAGALYSALAL